MFQALVIPLTRYLQTSADLALIKRRPRGRAPGYLLRSLPYVPKSDEEIQEEADAYRKGKRPNPWKGLPEKLSALEFDSEEEEIEEKEKEAKERRKKKLEEDEEISTEEEEEEKEKKSKKKKKKKKLEEDEEISTE